MRWLVMPRALALMAVAPLLTGGPFGVDQQADAVSHDEILHEPPRLRRIGRLLLFLRRPQRDETAHHVTDGVIGRENYYQVVEFAGDPGEVGGRPQAAPRARSGA